LINYFKFKKLISQKGQKWPQVATVFRDLLENEHYDRIYPTHPRIALEKISPPMDTRRWQFWFLGAQSREYFLHEDQD
jgi:hypothetical protein